MLVGRRGVERLAVVVSWVVCAGSAACFLPEATKSEASSSGAGAGAGGDSGGSTSGAGGDQGQGGGGAGAAGGGGGATCEPANAWPDSTHRCSDGSTGVCPLAAEDGNVAGTPPAFRNDGSVITDLVTGLSWQADATQDDPSPSWGIAEGHCAGLQLGGHDDWRMPTLVELVSLADFGTQPLAPPAFSAESDLFWTASQHPTGNHWGLNFGGGIVVGWGNNNTAFAALNVRCTRGCSAGELALDGDIVRDSRTGLAWQKSALAGTFEWEEALAACEAEGGGFRLPSIKELLSIFVPEPAKHFPSVFTPNEEASYWSSTPSFDNTAQAWGVSFDAVAILDIGAAAVARTETFRARCVRDDR
jgi:hypothetical protein